jgi:inorganic pyrophosphatase
MNTRKGFDHFRPHPWHGISTGKNPPNLVNAYIEINPSDGIKYEIDKETGYLKVDRPQLTSSLPPALYGFIPKTYCAELVAGHSISAKVGDGDPLDICVLSERPINKSEIIVPARVIGGLRLIDRNEADDKIIAVLDSDPYWDHVKTLKDLSKVVLSRLIHYFLTYKLKPGEPPKTKIERQYGNKEAEKVILSSIQDYKNHFA